ncbi:hypothetical protein ACVWZK_002690 [Bradyrhizobium sp. GM0.4]
MRTAPDITMLPAGAARRPLVMAAAIIAAMTLLRIVYASVIELRTDEAYYWTWSQETALSFLDHPPGIAWADPVRYCDLRRHHTRCALRRHRRDAGDAAPARGHRPPPHS